MYLLTPWCRIFFEKMIATQLSNNILLFLWNPKVHYRAHKSPPTEFSSPHRSISPKVHLNVILPPTLRSSQRSPTFGPSNQNPVNTSPLPHACLMSLPPHHLIFLDLITLTTFGEEYRPWSSSCFMFIMFHAHLCVIFNKCASLHDGVRN
jgi:hypothetical protein